MKSYSLPIEHDPERMSERHLWLGFCTPREFGYCEKQCEGSPCGYYKAAKMRGVNIDAITAEKKQQESDRKRRAKLNEHVEAVP